jgi:hypothetical protein
MRFGLLRIVCNLKCRLVIVDWQINVTFKISGRLMPKEWW